VLKERRELIHGELGWLVQVGEVVGITLKRSAGCSDELWVGTQWDFNTTGDS
jgi:hypothetical protein